MAGHLKTSLQIVHVASHSPLSIVYPAQKAGSLLSDTMKLET